MRNGRVTYTHWVILMLVLATALCAVDVTALDKSAVWNLYREAESAFKQANELLKSDPSKAGDLFEKAALCFETINREGGIENGRLLYNIGNIYFRLGDLGRAILNYRKAEKFIPNNTNLQQNLSYARSRCIDKIQAKPQEQIFRTVFFWHYDLSAPTRSWLFAASFALLWLIAGTYLLKRQAWLRHCAMSFALLCVLLAGSLGVEAYAQSHYHEGVILDKEVMGRKGDSATFEPTFKDPLHQGTEFNLVERRKGWLHIELADGRRCWIPESAAGII